MSVWVLMVSYKDGTTNVSQEAYQTYHEAVEAVEDKIDPNYKKIVNDYVTVDMERSIVYEIKTIFIKLK